MHKHDSWLQARNEGLVRLYGGTLPAACGEHQVHEVRLYYMYGTVIIGKYTTQYRYLTVGPV